MTKISYTLECCHCGAVHQPVVVDVPSVWNPACVKCGKINPIRFYEAPPIIERHQEIQTKESGVS